MNYKDLIQYYYDDFIKNNLKELVENFNTEWLYTNQITDKNLNLSKKKDLDLITSDGEVYWPIIVMRQGEKYYLFDSFVDFKLLHNDRKYLCIVLESYDLCKFLYLKHDPSELNLDFNKKVSINYREMYGVNFIFYTNKTVFNKSKRILRLTTNNYLILLEAISCYPFGLNNDLYVFMKKNKIMPSKLITDETHFKDIFNC